MQKDILHHICKFSDNLLKMWNLIFKQVFDFQQIRNSSEARVPTCQYPNTSIAPLTVSILHSEWYVSRLVQLYPYIVFPQNSCYTLALILGLVHSTDSREN